MDFNDQRMRLIRAACSFRIIDVTEQKKNPEFLEMVQAKAKIYYQNFKDTRPFEKVFKDTLIGELGEHAIFDICQKCGLESIHNEEQFSKQLYWDVAVEGLLIEVKFQHDPFYFGFDSKTKDQHLYDNWEKLDAIIGFYIKEKDDETFIVPWMMIDSAAINPKLQFYKNSTKNNGRYLTHEAAPAGLCVDLNVNKNKFSF